MAAGDPPVTLSPSDSVVKGSDILDKGSASPDAHDTPSPVVHAISIQSGLKAIPRLANKMCSQARVIARNLSRETAFCMRGKILAVSAWNVRTLMDAASQAIIVHTLSKYRVDIACLSEARLPHFESRTIINPGSEQRYWLYHCDASNNSGRNDVANVMSEKAYSALFEWISHQCPTLSANDRDKEDKENKFYAELQLLTKSLPKHDMIIMGRDWNARVSHNAAAMTSTIGKYGIGARNHYWSDMAILNNGGSKKSLLE
ncbi:unnamed protein product [Dracunculus medinensis]|uniref:Endo/exonuclease/phosphatase domain-containing protein n=1 Tax=Dracunculus medinensis TaxID=318479 RepID=A0A0N4UDA9_DRAME|nr:unnamed protein product [Dracunculus medinensis]